MDLQDPQEKMEHQEKQDLLDHVDLLVPEDPVVHRELVVCSTLCLSFVPTFGVSGVVL